MARTKSKEKARAKSTIENEDEKRPVKRLYRSRNDVMLGGVCAGIAEYFYADPTLIRLLWVIITLVSGLLAGILAYIIAWIIIPVSPRRNGF